jgi:uncharacterized protein (UPF0262 family)
MTEQPVTSQRIANVTLDERTVVRRSADIEHERRVAIFDLLEANSFAPSGLDRGPYHLHLAIEDNRLIMHINDTADRSLERVTVPVSPYRRLIKDYFTVCESYFEAIKRSSPSQIEAIDMGRRALHNEGSDMLREQLADKVAIDDDTARRLFTLLCVLHIRA